MSQIIDPILSATLPETPVSISSKTIEGILVYFANIAFRHNIIRDISPPEAHFETSVILTPEAENINEISSFPVGDNSVSDNVAKKAALSNSNPLIDACMDSEKGPIAPALDS